MSVVHLLKKSEKLLADNSPAILTAIGVTGVITTAYFTGKASFKAASILEAADEEKRTTGYVRGYGLTPREKFELLWKLYIPAVATGVGTITCIIMANRIGTRRAAAMASAYVMSERAFTEYKEKVVEQLGEKREQKIRDEIQQERMDRDGVTLSPLPAGSRKVWCKDAWSGRYFPGSMEIIKKAQNDTNHEVLSYGYASLTDFYSRLGLEGTKDSDNLGWNSDKMMDVTFTTALSDDQEPVLVMDFAVAPIRNFFRTR